MRLSQITESTDFTSGIDPFLATTNPDGTYTLNQVTVKKTRTLTLNEAFDVYGRLVQLLGDDVVGSTGKYGKPLLDAPTETPNDGDVEIWEIYNLTGDTHPIHFHLFNVQVLNRETFTGTFPNVIPGDLRGPDPTDVGWKETVRMNPGEITRVIMKVVVPKIKKANGTVIPTPFSPRLLAYNLKAYEYVWHCHILEHEEHDMMRPLAVLKP